MERIGLKVLLCAVIAAGMPAAREKPDGYSLLLNTTPLVTNTLMYSKVPYNVLKDFDTISILSTTPSFVSVHPSVPARSTTPGQAPEPTLTLPASCSIYSARSTSRRSSSRAAVPR